MNILKKLNPILGITILSFLIGLYSNSQIHFFQKRQKTNTYKVGHPIHAALVKTFSGGHLPAVVDWIFMSALLDTSLEYLPVGQHSQFYYQMELASDLDPLHQQLYEVGATLAAIAQKDISGAHALITKGIRFLEQKLPHYPESFQKKYWDRQWQLFLLLAYLELFELKNIPAAADAFVKAAHLAGAPSYLGRLEKRLSQPGGKYQFGIQVLGFMINIQKDPKIIEELKKDRLSLMIGNFLFELNLKFSTFLKEKQKRQHSFTHSLASKKQLESLWLRWMQQQKIPLKDPLGGKLSWSLTQNRIVSTSAHPKTFELDDST